MPYANRPRMLFNVHSPVKLSNFSLLLWSFCAQKILALLVTFEYISFLSKRREFNEKIDFSFFTGHRQFLFKNPISLLSTGWQRARQTTPSNSPSGWSNLYFSTAIAIWWSSFIRARTEATTWIGSSTTIPANLPNRKIVPWSRNCSTWYQAEEVRVQWP